MGGISEISYIRDRIIVGMSELAARDLDRLLDLATAIVGGLAGDTPWRLVAAEVNTCLRGTATLWTGDLDVRTSVARELVWAPEAASVVQWDLRMRQMGNLHPLARLYAAPSVPQPLSVNDVVSERTWRRNPVYDAVQREIDGAVRHLALPLPSPKGIVRSLITCRSGSDYDDRERMLVRRLQPLLVSVDRHLTETRRLGKQNTADTYGVTPRERVVLNVLAEGLTAAAAARRLGISLHTINKHLENVYRKFGTRDRATTMLLAREVGVLTATVAGADRGAHDERTPRSP